jgi:hypothetical protein
MSNRHSIFKQIAGAVIGGSLGLLVYSGYHVTSPVVTAWLTIPQKDLASNGEGSRLAETDRTERTNTHFEARAREIAENFGAAYKNYHIGEVASAASSSGNVSSSVPMDSSLEAIPFEGTAENTNSSVGKDVTSAGPSSEQTGSDRAKAVRELWDDEAIVKAPGPDSDGLPDSGIGVLGALIAAGAGAGGLRARKGRRA